MGGTQNYWISTCKNVWQCQFCSWLIFRRDSLLEGVAGLARFPLSRCARNAVHVIHFIKVHIWTCCLAFNNRGFCSLTHRCLIVFTKKGPSLWLDTLLFVPPENQLDFFYILNIPQSSILILSSNGFSTSDQITLLVFLSHVCPFASLSQDTSGVVFSLCQFTVTL